MLITLGESAHLYKELNIPSVIHVKRIESADFVRFEKADKFEESPWDTVGK